MQCKVKRDMLFYHPTKEEPKASLILKAGTIVRVLIPSEMSDKEKKWLSTNRRNDPPSKKRVAFRWEGRFRTAFINDDLAPHAIGGVITNRKW